MIEVELYPQPGLAVFDGHVIEIWHGQLAKSTYRWHVRFIKSAWCTSPDKSGRTVIYVDMEVMGRMVVGTTSSEQRQAAEQFITGINDVIAKDTNG